MSCLLILNVNALIFYETKGASLLLISFFTALARCIELFLKPIIAFSSDNSNFKKGRRKPFMLFGCGFYCVFLVRIFSPPFKHMTPIATSLWFGVFDVLFFIADTICTIPYHALGPELSIDSKEREHDTSRTRTPLKYLLIDKPINYDLTYLTKNKIINKPKTNNKLLKKILNFGISINDVI